MKHVQKSTYTAIADQNNYSGNDYVIDIHSPTCKTSIGIQNTALERALSNHIISSFVSMLTISEL